MKHVYNVYIHIYYWKRETEQWQNVAILDITGTVGLQRWFILAFLDTRTFKDGYRHVNNIISDD